MFRNLSAGRGGGPPRTARGAVNDDTGGVLPGVTGEAVGPALIEGSRLAVTDAQGRYAFTALRPGVYTVTFNPEQLAGIGSVGGGGGDRGRKRRRGGADGASTRVLRPRAAVGFSRSSPAITDRGDGAGRPVRTLRRAAMAGGEDGRQGLQHGTALRRGPLAVRR